MVKIHTNCGVITLELDSEKTPVTVENFLRYIDSGHYDNTLFHRVIDGFMIQGGGYTSGMKEKETLAPIQNEAALNSGNETYTIAMARTSNVHSATAQFFINVANNHFLNHTDTTPQGFGYCVFGRVIEGKEVVDTIKKMKTGPNAGHQDVPLEDVIIQKVERA